MAKVFYTIAEGENTTRRAVSFTPASSMELHHIGFTAKRSVTSRLADYAYDVETFSWEVRADAGAGNKPGTSAASLLASGSFVYTDSSVWKTDREIQYVVFLSNPIDVVAGTRYWFVLKSPNDYAKLKYPLSWATTYNTGAAGEVSSDVYTSYYSLFDGTWGAGDNTFNFVIDVPSEQTGGMWSVRINGYGYMSPQELNDLQAEPMTSGIAAATGGASEYSRLTYPYTNFSQDSWLSGGGELTMDDPSTFLYGLSVDTTVKNQLIAGPLAHLTGLAGTEPEYAPSTLVARTLPDVDLSSEGSVVSYFAQKFTPTTSFTATKIAVRLNKMPHAWRYSPYLALYSDNAGVPNTALTSFVQVVPYHRYAWAVATVNQALTSGTAYWIVVKTNQITLNTPEFRVLFDTDGSAAGGNAFYSVSGSSWTELTGASMAYRINEGQHGLLNGDVAAFEYGYVGGADCFYCAAGKVVYQWNTSADVWESISDGIEGSGTTTTSANIVAMKVYDGYLHVSQGYSYPVRVWDGTSWGPDTTSTLVTNGGFDSTTASWTASAKATLTSEAGGQAGNCLKVAAAVGFSYQYAYQEIATTAGKWYEFSYYHKNGNSDTGHVKLGLTVTARDYYDSGALDDSDWSQYTVLFKATGSSVFLTLFSGIHSTGEYCLFDTVVLREAEVGKYFNISQGYLWMSTAVNKVKQSNTGFSWAPSSGINVGDSLYEINGFANYNGEMIIGKENGLWTMDDSDVAVEYYRFDPEADPENCKGMTVWSGMLFIPVQASIWRWSSSSYKEVGPTDQTAGPTSSWPNRITRMAATGAMLWATASPSQTSGYGGLMGYNGQGWHYIATHNTANKSCNALFITSEIDDEYRVWYAEGRRVSYIRLSKYTNNRYDWADADFDILGPRLVTGWWDAGVRYALKAWNQVTFVADIPDKTWISVYAAADGKDWTTNPIYLGTLGYQQAQDGTYTLQFPDGLVAKSVQLIFCMYTNDSTVTPRIRAYNIEAVLRRPVTMAYVFRVLLASNLTRMDGSSETTRDALTMWSELKAAYNTNSPILVELPGMFIRAMITDLRMRMERFYSNPDGSDFHLEQVATVSLLEME
jgi:hypothetical protein